MAYKLEYAPEAVEYLEKMDKTQAKRIMNKLDWLAENAEIYPHEAMTGNWVGYFRIRIGKYRAIYIIEQARIVILITNIGHRRDVYDE